MSDPRQIAEERFARGEIGEEEFHLIIDRLSNRDVSQRPSHQHHRQNNRENYDERMPLHEDRRRFIEARPGGNGLGGTDKQYQSREEAWQTRQAESIAVSPDRMAGFWYRALAAVIDTALSYIAMMIVVFPLAFLIGMSMGGSATDQEIGAVGELFGGIAGLVIGWLWFTLPESSSWQASVGKKMVGLKVTDENGSRIGFGKANARYWSKILSALILMIGFLMAAFTEKKQGLHDIIAKTYVLKKSK